LLPSVVFPAYPASFFSSVQLAETRISPARRWFHRATANDSVPGTTPSIPAAGFGRVKMAPTSGRCCSAATIALTRAGSASPRKYTAPSATTISGEPSGSGFANGATRDATLNVPVCVENP